jgi:predicted ATPase
MALPEAEILLFDDSQMRPKPYEELDHVKITKAFLNDPTKFLRHL